MKQDKILSAQKALDNIPEGIKSVLRRSLRISISALREDTEEDNTTMIDSFAYLEEKLR